MELGGQIQWQLTRGQHNSAPSTHPHPRLTNSGSYVTFSHVQGWTGVGQEMGEGWEGQWCATRQWKDVFVNICFSACSFIPVGRRPPSPSGGVLWSGEVSAGAGLVVSPGAPQAPGQLPGGRVGVSGAAILQGTKKTSVWMDETPAWPSDPPQTFPSFPFPCPWARGGLFFIPQTTKRLCPSRPRLIALERKTAEPWAQIPELVLSPIRQRKQKKQREGRTGRRPARPIREREAPCSR